MSELREFERYWNAMGAANPCRLCLPQTRRRWVAIGKGQIFLLPGVTKYRPHAMPERLGAARA